jgi:hypothetical protein
VSRAIRAAVLFLTIGFTVWLAYQRAKMRLCAITWRNAMNVEQIGGLVRHALTVLGGYLVAKGALDPAAVDTIVGAIMTLGGAGWSFMAKKQAA